MKQETDAKDQQVSQLSANVNRLQDQVSQAAGDGASVAALRAQLQVDVEIASGSGYLLVLSHSELILEVLTNLMRLLFVKSLALENVKMSD